MSTLHKKNQVLIDGLLAACRRVVAMDGTAPAVSMRATQYVLNGSTYTITTSKGDYRFWFGANGPRLFFITFVKGVSPEQAKEKYAFCFGGAAKVGWELNYEPIEGGVSIWATCMTEPELAFAEVSPNTTTGLAGAPVYNLTEYGDFWVTDVAMMVQSWIRTSERFEIECHEMEPAPL
jgi:hypothetical protein